MDGKLDSEKLADKLINEYIIKLVAKEVLDRAPRQINKSEGKKILHDGKVHGKKLTAKQRRFFGHKSK